MKRWKDGRTRSDRSKSQHHDFTKDNVLFCAYRGTHPATTSLRGETNGVTRKLYSRPCLTVNKRRACTLHRYQLSANYLPCLQSCCSCHSHQCLRGGVDKGWSEDTLSQTSARTCVSSHSHTDTNDETAFVMSCHVIIVMSLSTMATPQTLK